MKKIFILLFVLFSILPRLSLASLQQDKVLLDHLSSYIRNLDNMTGQFVQIDAYGKKTTGSVFIKKGRRVLFVYDEPKKKSIIINGFWVSIQKENKKPQIYPLRITPLPLFLGDNVDLYKNGYVQEIKTYENRVHVILRDPKRKILGQIQLHFRYPEFQLLGWQVVNAKKKTTTLIFRHVKNVDSIDDSIFMIKAARKKGKRR